MSSTLSVRSDLSCRSAGRLGEEVPRPSVPLSAAVPVLELGFGVASCRAFTTIGCSCEAWPPGVGSNVSHLTLSPRYLKKSKGPAPPRLAARKARQFLAMPMASIRADAVQLGAPNPCWPVPGCVVRPGWPPSESEAASTMVTGTLDAESGPQQVLPMRADRHVRSPSPLLASRHPSSRNNLERNVSRSLLHCRGRARVYAI